MKLLFYLTRYPGWGGIETVTSLIIPELQKRGYLIDIISHRQQMEAQVIPPEVTLYKMPAMALFNDENFNFANNIVRNGKYDFIIYQDCYEPNERIVVEIAKRNNIPLLVFEHNTPLLLYKVKFVSPLWTIKGLIKRSFYPIFRWRYLRAERKRKLYLYDNCNKYVMLSKNYISEISKRLGIKSKENKFRFINNPIILPLRSIDNVKSKEILFVGRLVNEKRVDKILKIWRCIYNLYPDYSLSIVGDGPERNNLEKMAIKLGLNNVKFYGFQNPVEFYMRSKIFLMTSKFEGWGMTLMEAMCYGCIPFVENNFSSLTDIIQDKITGVILPEKASIRQWTKELSLLMGNEGELERISAKAKEKVKIFSVENIANQWEKLFKE